MRGDHRHGPARPAHRFAVFVAIVTSHPRRARPALAPQIVLANRAATGETAGVRRRGARGADEPALPKEPQRMTTSFLTGFSGEAGNSSAL